MVQLPAPTETSVVAIPVRAEGGISVLPPPAVYSLVAPPRPSPLIPSSIPATTSVPPATSFRETASRRYLPVWCGWLLLTLGLLTLPWIAGIVVFLPSRAQTAHYDISWAGFDVLLCLLLLRNGWSVLRDRPSTGLSAAMAGSLLIVDAWFDVMSATSTTALVVAIAMAVLVELPLAVFCLWMAGHVEIERRRRVRALLRRLDAGRIARPPTGRRRGRDWRRRSRDGTDR